jgi:tight adherence protein B
MSPLFICITAGLGVAALVGGVALLFRGGSDAEVEQRLSVLTGKGGPKKDGQPQTEILLTSLEGGVGFLEKFFSRFFNISRLFQQADVDLTLGRFFLTCGIFATAGAALAAATGLRVYFVPLVAGSLGSLPFMWLVLRRRRRLKKFQAQLPDALELIARALRAGHSLASGFSLVSREMSEPISKEFARVFEEQNLGIPMDEALQDLTERVPNLDLKFFATAVVLQRQTGGDLAEILDKIGELVRERFRIWGQVQALTGEGRLSGIVLLALPPALFVVVYKLNPDYVMLLFTDDLGKKMLIGGAIMQLLGAVVIKKIVNIRV